MNQLRIVALAMVLFAATTCSAVQAQEVESPSDRLALTSSTSNLVPQLTFPQQVARYQAQQRVLRMEFNNWIGYSPLRPNMNASWMSNGVQQFYIPSRGVFVSAGPSRSWYW